MPGRRARTRSVIHRRPTVSQPPDFPGSRRLKRVAKNSGGSAYEGAFEAVGAILIATLLGYWFDEYYETTPNGVLVGAAVGFGAFVLRLFRMGRQLHPEPGADGTATEAAVETAASRNREGRAASGESERQAAGREPHDREEDADRVGTGIGLGLSEALRSDGEESDSERKDEDR